MPLVTVRYTAAVLNLLMTNELTSSLNALLISLKIPYSLVSPLDLTPSILLAILESLLDSRIPIPPPSRIDQVHIVKVFLGVLENDIVRADVGLSGIDPRRLANGGQRECHFIGELLCWLGRRLARKPEPSRLIRRKASPVSGELDGRKTPSPLTDNDLPARRDGRSLYSSSTRSFSASASIPKDGNSDMSRYLHDMNASPFSTREQIVNLSSGDKTSTQCYYHCPSGLRVEDFFSQALLPMAVQSPTRKIVRQTGYIGITDEDVEISSFCSSLTQNCEPSVLAVEQTAKVSTWSTLTDYNLTLLTQRAKLLAELARLRAQ